MGLTQFSLIPPPVWIVSYLSIRLSGTLEASISNEETCVHGGLLSDHCSNKRLRASRLGMLFGEYWVEGFPPAMMSLTS